MNGAELPCGSVIHVEPARSNRDNNDATGTLDPYEPAKTESGTTSTCAPRDQDDNKNESATNLVAEEEDDDLENFFNSL